MVILLCPQPTNLNKLITKAIDTYPLLTGFKKKLIFVASKNFKLVIAKYIQTLTSCCDVHTAQYKRTNAVYSTITTNAVHIL